MLPKPDELRELSKRFIQAVHKATAVEVKQRLAADAMALAQVAEQLERGDPLNEFVHAANLERYKRLLAGALDEGTRATVEKLRAEENSAKLDKRWDQAKRWRTKAEELRATADQFADPSAHETLIRAAENYDRLADHAESLSKGKSAGEKAR